MIILAIDPGSSLSAFVVYDIERKQIKDKRHCDNREVLAAIKGLREGTDIECMAIESVKSYGNIMGDTMLLTCEWIGRFIQVWDKRYIKLPRKTIVSRLCQNPRAKDSNVRQALIDRFSEGLESGGALGCKNKQGPLYGFKNDLWSALAVAVVGAEILSDPQAFLM